MDFPQQPQGVTPFPSVGQPSTPPPFPNVGNNPMPAPATPAAGPMPGATMPPLSAAPDAGVGMGTVPPAVQIPVQSHAAAAMPGEEQVYTMPDKFLAGTTPVPIRAKKSNKALTIILVAVIVLMVLGAVGGVLYYFLVLANQTTTTTDAQNAVVVNDTNTTNANTANVNNSNANSNVNATLNQNANANVNAEVNDNSNAVVNDNTNTANANTNENENVNSDVNSNANTNTNANSNTNTVSAVPPASKDSDADALTNDEEAVWTTKADLPDTDGDGYTDGAEILAGYDPTNATSAGRLADSTLVSSFANTKFNYTMLYPQNWLAEGLTEGDATEVVFTPNTLDLAGQFIAVTVATNPTGLTASEWYAETANVDEADLETVTSFSGAVGVWNVDRSTAYYADSDYIYAISYRYGNSDELYFPTSFEMMVKSFSNE